jgi:hypothetical protein
MIKIKTKIHEVEIKYMLVSEANNSVRIIHVIV